jgi:hypothetical protein
MMSRPTHIDGDTPRLPDRICRHWRKDAALTFTLFLLPGGNYSQWVKDWARRRRPRVRRLGTLGGIGRLGRLRARACVDGQLAAAHRAAVVATHVGIEAHIPVTAREAGYLRARAAHSIGRIRPRRRCNDRLPKGGKIRYLASTNGAPNAEVEISSPLLSVNHWGHLRDASRSHDRERGRLAGNDITYLLRARSQSRKIGCRDNSRWSHSSSLAANSD